MPAPSASLAVLRRRAAEQRVPLHASFEVTHNCNLRCRHCYLTGHLGKTKGQLRFAEIVDVLDQLAEMQTLFLQLTGGEFFCRADSFEILEAAAKRDFVISLFTNGLVIKEEHARRIAACNVYQVHVSILGNETSHDLVADRKGAFQRSARAMDFLRAAGVSVMAKVVLTRPSAPDYEEIKKFCEAHADDMVVSVDLLPTIDGIHAPTDLLLTADDLKRLPQDTQMEHFCHPEPDPHGSVCNAGRSLITIDPYGNVFPCISYRRSVGNVREMPLRALWNGGKMNEIADLKQGDLVDCGGCSERASCNYCPGRAWQSTGDPRRAAANNCARTERLGEAFLPQGAAAPGQLVPVHSLIR